MEEKWLAVIIAAVIAALVLFASVWSISWMIGDAQKRGQTGCLPILLVALWGPLAAVVWLAVWLVFRPKRLVDKAPNHYQNAEDALSAASRLDTQGDWDAAIELYQFSAERWPEHQSYIEQCVDQIRKKQAFTSG